MIRPSALQIADAGCGLAAKLAEQYPEASVYAEKGTKIHEDIAGWLRGGKPTTPEGKALALHWPAPALVAPEVAAELVDPETDQLVTKGTADAVWMKDGVLHVVDWKTGRPENVAEPDDNLQLAAYALALALSMEAETFVVGLCFLDGASPPDFRWSRQYGHDDWGAIWTRVTRAASRPPIAVTGPHCGKCYQVRHCPAYLAPVIEKADKALVPFTKPGGLTAENGPQALLLVEAMEELCELARAQLQALALEIGGIVAGDKVWGPTSTKGRRGISLKDCEAAGLLPQLEAAGVVKTSAPSTRFAWRNAR